MFINKYVKNKGVASFTVAQWQDMNTQTPYGDYFTNNTELKIRATTYKLENFAVKPPIS